MGTLTDMAAGRTLASCFGSLTAVPAQRPIALIERRDPRPKKMGGCQELLGDRPRSRESTGCCRSHHKANEWVRIDPSG